MFDHDLCIQKTFSSQIPLKGETEKGPSLRNKESQDSDELAAFPTVPGRKTSSRSRKKTGQKGKLGEAKNISPINIDAAAIPAMVSASRDGSLSPQNTLPPPDIDSSFIKATEKLRLDTERLGQELAEMKQMAANLLSRDADMRASQKSGPSFDSHLQWVDRFLAAPQPEFNRLMDEQSRLMGEFASKPPRGKSLSALSSRELSVPKERHDMHASDTDDADEDSDQDQDQEHAVLGTTVEAPIQDTCYALLSQSHTITTSVFDDKNQVVSSRSAHIVTTVDRTREYGARANPLPDSIRHTDSSLGCEDSYQEEPPRYHQGYLGHDAYSGEPSRYHEVYSDSGDSPRYYQEYEGHDAYSGSDSDQEPSPYLDVYNRQESPEPDASEQATYT